MRYLLLICAGDSVEVSPEESDPEPWVTQMESRGVRIEGHRLRPSAEAKTVRVRRGERLATDGPFAETKELIGGFDVIDCADLDEALEIASKHPVARFGAIEVRPFWQQ